MICYSHSLPSVSNSSSYSWTKWYSRNEGVLQNEALSRCRQTISTSHNVPPACRSHDRMQDPKSIFSACNIRRSFHCRQQVHFNGKQIRDTFRNQKAELMKDSNIWAKITPLNFARFVLVYRLEPVGIVYRFKNPGRFKKGWNFQTSGGLM